MFNTNFNTAVRSGETNPFHFPFTDDQQNWIQVADQVGQHSLASNAAMVDEGNYPIAGIKASWAAGLGSMVVSAQNGGGGADLVAIVAVVERLAQYCASTAMILHMHMSALQLLNRAADSPNDRTRVERVVTDQLLCTYATSEATSGSRWWHMDSVARWDGTSWVITASKSWATSAGKADLYIVPLRSGPHAGPNELTLFVVPAGEGVKPIGTWDGSGMRGNCSTPVDFDLVLPDSARLGPSGYGFEVLLAYGLTPFQLGLSAVYLGIAQAAYDSAVHHAVTRRYADTGQTKADGETTQRRLAEMRLRIDQARCLTYVLADATKRFDSVGIDFADLDDDVGFLASVASAKVAACEAACAVTDEALKVCGGSAFKRGHVVERCYRDARAGSIMGPDDDSLKVLIGQRLLGKPYPWRR